MNALLETLAIVPVSLLLYAPYFATVHNSKGIGFQANPTAFGDVLTVIGGLLAPVAVFVVWRAGAALAGQARPERDRSPIVIQVIDALPAGSGWWVIYAILILLFVLPARTDLFYCVLLVAGTYALLSRIREDEPELQAALLLGAVGIAVLLIGDFAYLRDNFDNTANYRMNTVFKLFYQAWILLAVAVPFAVFAVSHALRHLKSKIPYWTWIVVAVILAAGLAIYPVEGIGSQPARMESTTGLDGLAYMRSVDPDEYAAINWVRNNTSPSDVIAEAYGPDYWGNDPASSANKMSALTGRPTVIGWPGSHEALWRGDFGTGADAQAAGTMIAQRESDVRDLYTSPDVQTAIGLIRKYRIAYVYVGPYERATYGATAAGQQGLQKFNSFLKPVPQVQFLDATLFKVSASLNGG
jgi:uncharacterized membrane protein